MKNENQNSAENKPYTLDPLLTTEIRFFIMTVLAMYDIVDFSFLKKELDASDGNLSVNLSKLEEGGYLTSKKEFVGKKPKTSYQISSLGLQRLKEYIEKVNSFKTRLTGK